jgi:hypothetical protein
MSNLDDILEQLEDIQTKEKDFIHTLETDTTLTAKDKQSIIKTINSLINIRGDLYETLGGINKFFSKSLDSSLGTLKEQVEAISIVEYELNNAKKKLNILEEDNSNKIRLIEINEYYGEKYSEHATFMKIVIFTLIPIIILTIIKKQNYIPIPIPDAVYYILIIIISIIGAIFGWNTFFSIISRDNMNYDTYEWAFNQNGAPAANSGSGYDPYAITTECVGSQCCPNNYNTVTQKCIENGTSTSTTTSTTTPTTTSTTPTTTSSGSTTTSSGSIYSYIFGSGSGSGSKVCSSGQHLNSGSVCVQTKVCPSGQHYDLNSDSCVSDCPYGEYMNDSGTCEEIPFCPPGQYKNKYKQCVPDLCPRGKHMKSDGSQCVPDVPCQPDYHLSNGTCVPNKCPPGEVWTTFTADGTTSGVCVPAKQGFQSKINPEYLNYNYPQKYKADVVLTPEIFGYK